MNTMTPQRIAIFGATWPKYELYCPHFSGMQLALSNMGIDHRFYNIRPSVDQIPIDDLIDYEPGLIVYGLLDMVRAHELRKTIRRALPRTKIVMWYGDLRRQQRPADMSEIDALFISNDAQHEYYRGIWRVSKSHYLPLGAQVYENTYDPRFDKDFVFVGMITTGGDFQKRASKIIRFQEHGLTVVNADPAKDADLRARIMQNLGTLYRSSKVILDVSHYIDIPGYTSNRFWVIPAHGGFALTKRWPGCTDFYPEGTRAYFNTFAEALELRDYYLQHPDEREKIRLAGYAHAVNHTYERRFGTMFSLLYGKQGSENGLRQCGIQAPRAPEQARPREESA